MFMTCRTVFPYSYFIYLKQPSLGIYKYMYIHTYIHIIYSFLYSINIYYILHNHVLALPMTSNECLYHLELYKLIFINYHRKCVWLFLSVSSLLLFPQLFFLHISTQNNIISNTHSVGMKYSKNYLLSYMWLITILLYLGPWCLQSNVIS